MLGLVVILLTVGGISFIRFARGTEPVKDNRADWLTSTLIAHRGMHSEKENIPENTMSAFLRAMENGKTIELDVALTKDKKVVVFHDKKLKRLFGIDAYLQDLTFEELSKLKFPNSLETVPLFADVLTLIAGRVPLLIEIKNEGEVGELESMVYAQLKSYPGKYAIQSFNPFSLGWFRKNAPQVLRGQLSGSFLISDYEVEYAGTTRLPWYKRFLLSNLLLNFVSRPNFIAYEVDNTSVKTFKNLKKLGVPILGWTIRDKDQYQRLKNECDNFITEIFELP